MRFAAYPHRPLGQASLFRSHYRHRAVFYRGVETPASFSFRSIFLYRRAPAPIRAHEFDRSNTGPKRRGPQKRWSALPAMRSFSSTKWPMNRTNPSPDSRRLVKASSRATLSPRERGVIPPRAAFHPKERSVIQKYRTPRQVQDFLRNLPYNWEKGGETLRTFRGVVRHGSGHCLEGALSAAAILEQHGYPPLLLDLESQDQLDHVLFLFRQRPMGNGRPLP
jgi:hypothetical protein